MYVHANEILCIRDIDNTESVGESSSVSRLTREPRFQSQRPISELFLAGK